MMRSTASLKQGLAAKARGFIPPVRLVIEDGTVDGASVIVVQVSECDRADHGSCRRSSSPKPERTVHYGPPMPSPRQRLVVLSAQLDGSVVMSARSWLEPLGGASVGARWPNRPTPA
jgi:hypothetical protein